MKTAQFIGREAEMARLKGLLSTRSANLIVVRGRKKDREEQAACRIWQGNKELVLFWKSTGP